VCVCVCVCMGVCIVNLCVCVWLDVVDLACVIMTGKRGNHTLCISIRNSTIVFPPVFTC